MMKHASVWWVVVAVLSLTASSGYTDDQDFSSVNAQTEEKTDAQPDPIRPPAEPGTAKPDPIRQSAERGDARAQVKLGIQYYEGNGVLQNYKESVKWLQKAAGQGETEGQYQLGERYRNGEGVPKDYVRAHVLFNLAATRGNKEAAESRAAVTRRMTATQLEEAQALAQQWKPNQEETGETDNKKSID